MTQVRISLGNLLCNVVLTVRKSARIMLQFYSMTCSRACCCCKHCVADYFLLQAFWVGLAGLAVKRLLLSAALWRSRLQVFPKRRLPQLNCCTCGRGCVNCFQSKLDKDCPRATKRIQDRTMLHHKTEQLSSRHRLHSGHVLVPDMQERNVHENVRNETGHSP